MSLEWMKSGSSLWQNTKDILAKVEWKKIATGAALAGGGAVLTYLAQWLSSSDFGAWGPLVVAVASVLLNIGRKLTISSKLI